MEFNGFLKVVVDRQGVTDTKIDHEGPLNAADVRIIAGDLTPVFKGFESEPNDTKYIVTGEATSDEGDTLSINFNASKGAMLAFAGNVQAGTSDQSQQNGASTPGTEPLKEGDKPAEIAKEEEIAAKNTEKVNEVTESSETKVEEENKETQSENQEQ